MLVLSRRVGESVVIGDNIVVTVLAVRGKQVRVGFEAPRGVVIRRQEKEWHDLPPSEDLGASGSDLASVPLPAREIM